MQTSSMLANKQCLSDIMTHCLTVSNPNSDSPIHQEPSTGICSLAADCWGLHSVIAARVSDRGSDIDRCRVLDAL